MEIRAPVRHKSTKNLFIFSVVFPGVFDFGCIVFIPHIISDCNITIRDTDVKKGKKLTLNHQNAVILGPGFKMEAGSELKINPLEDW